MSEWLDNVRAVIQAPETAGTVGALLSLRWAPGGTFAVRAVSVIGGLSVAMWGMPWICEVMHITSKAGLGFFVFLGGLCGMNLLTKIVEHVAATPLGQLLSALLPRKKVP